MERTAGVLEDGINSDGTELERCMDEDGGRKVQERNPITRTKFRKQTDIKD